MELQNINSIDEYSVNDENQLDVQQDQDLILVSEQNKVKQFIFYDIQNSCLKFYKLFLIQWKKIEKYSFYITLTVCVLFLFKAFYLFALQIDGLCRIEEYKSGDDCIERLIEVVPIWIKCIFISAGILVSIIVLSLAKKIHYINGVLATIQVLYMIFVYNGPMHMKRMTLRDSRLAHSYMLLFFTSQDLLCAFIIFLTYKIYQRSRKAFIVYILVLLVIIIKLWNIFDKSCENWDQGMVHSLDTSDKYCEIKRPSICWSNIFDNTFNMGPYTCDIPNEDIHDYKINVLKNYLIIDEKDDTSVLNQDQILVETQFIGWPSFNEMDISLRSQEVTIQEYIVNNTKIYNSKEEAFQDGREAVVDVNNLDFDFKIVRNETLVQERQKKNVEESLAKNMIVIFIDTVSRRQLYRKLKKTMAFLKRYADFDGENYEEEGLGAKTFESFRFHSVDRKTQSNTFKLRYNMMYRDFRKEKVPLDKNNKITSLFNDIKDAGYIFGHSLNGLSTKYILGKHFFNDEPLYEFFDDDPADHQMFMFDPNYVNLRNTYDLTKGGNSMYRRCLYGKDTNYYVLDYAKKFLEAYKNDKKFLMIELIDSHELTSEILQYLDDNLYNFLVYLQTDGYLSKETAFYMMSDHGQHLIFYLWVFKNLQSEQQQERDFYAIEKVLPFFLTTMTNDVLEKYQDKLMQQTLVTNEQRIFGMGEVRNTLLTTAYGYDYKYNYRKEMNVTNYNLFQELPTDRSCLDIGMTKLKNPFEFCSCKPDGDFNKLYKIQQKEEKEKIEQWKKEREEEKQNDEI